MSFLQKEPVTLSGVLLNHGHETDCVVQATRVTLPGSNAAEHAEFNIVKTAKSLPPGHYQLLIDGKVIPIRHEDGLWLAAA